MAPLFSLPAPGAAAYPFRSPHSGRQRMTLLLEWLRRAAHERPLVLLVENFHWADSALREIVELHAEERADASILTVVTTRQGAGLAWRFLPWVTTLQLPGLREPDLARIVARIARPRMLPPELVQAIIDRCGGNPLFAEELTRSVLDAPGRHELGDPATQRLLEVVPVRLRDLLMSHLDQLGEARALAQVAAVLGPRFSHDLLRRVSGWSESSLLPGGCASRRKPLRRRRSSA